MPVFELYVSGEYTKKVEARDEAHAREILKSTEGFDHSWSWEEFSAGVEDSELD